MVRSSSRCLGLSTASRQYTSPTSDASDLSQDLRKFDAPPSRQRCISRPSVSERVGRQQQVGAYARKWRALVFAVTVAAITTNTAATAIAMSHRTQSMPGLPLPPSNT
jgi:hypothetical protein